MTTVKETLTIVWGMVAHSPDEEHGGDDVLLREKERHQAGERVRGDDQEPRAAEPGHDFSPALQKLADDDREKQAGECRHRRQQPDLEIAGAQPREKDRQKRRGRAG